MPGKVIESGGGISGLGSADNALLRADGAGGATAQGSDTTLSDAEVLDLAAATGELRIDGTKVVDAQQSFVADAQTAHSITTGGGDTITAAEVNGMLDALGAKINAAFTVLKNHGLKASS